MAEFIPDTETLKDNKEQRQPCVLVLDGSGSMSGEKIDALNEGIAVFAKDLQEDELASLKVQVCVIRFGDNNEVETLSEFVDAIDFEPPTVQANGYTPLGAAMQEALDKVEAQKQAYRDAGITYWRPWIWLLSDGEPTDDWEAVADACVEAENNKKAKIFAVGIGEGSNLATLGRFTASGQAVQLNGMKFREFFKFLSASSKAASTKAPGEAQQLAPPPGLFYVSS